MVSKKIISTELVIFGSENCYSFLGGTDREYFHLSANNYLKYEIIKWAKEKGLKRFILGGGYGADDGIFKYKKSFAPNGVCSFYVGKKVFNEEKYNELVQMRNEDMGFESDNLFFPKYRA
ncbi:GNAT family N-acetyltransferase [Planococcus faecalis]|uniref:GNAT family N-acetyltransferase n=1 Tax=Planococcus faecalis TaxID=1598147 RepID=UPI001C42F3A9|nr:GNAT family N-acetyltransferase [Planococcus faecalis]